MNKEKAVLNENPNKKKKDTSHPTKWQYFWRIQREGWRRMVTPALMYMFMSLIALTVSSLITDVKNYFPVIVVIDTVCVLCGAAFNAHLCYNYGKMHYDAYITGCLHRKNELFGIASGGNHQPEKEYRVWKGFFIGFLVGVPVLVLGALASIPGWDWMLIIMSLMCWWAYIPASWVAIYHQNVMGIEGFTVAAYWAFPMIVLPIIVSGVFYIVGAYVNKRNRESGKLSKAEQELKR